MVTEWRKPYRICVFASGFRPVKRVKANRTHGTYTAIAPFLPASPDSTLLRSDGEILVVRRGGVWYTPRGMEAEAAEKALGGTPTGETIDITPEGCKTPEGNARVNRALAHVDEASRRVADLATQMVDRLAANQQWQSDEHDVLKAAIQHRKDAYRELLRAVAGK